MSFTAYPESGPPINLSPTDTEPHNGPRLQTWRHGYAADQKLTSWPLRLASGAIDYVPLFILGDLFSAMHAFAVGFFLIVVVVLANNVYMQGTTGQSLGKRIVGTRLVSLVDIGPTTFAFAYPGVGRCFGRQLAHAVDCIVFYLGWFRPIWQRYHQTWADSIAKTVVVSVRDGAEVIRRPEGARSTL
jgi:uncharacterized RDD family membrane protein YckC